MASPLKAPKRHSFQLKHVIHATFPPKPLIKSFAHVKQEERPVLHSSSVSDWPLESLSLKGRDPALQPIDGAQSFVKSFVPRASFLKYQDSKMNSKKHNKDPFLKVQSWASHEHQASPLEPLKELRTPDPKDPKTVLALGKMTFNAYIEPTDKSWKQIPGWEVVNKLFLYVTNGRVRCPTLFPN
jgi:hypothetical protein